MVGKRAPKPFGLEKFENDAFFWQEHLSTLDLRQLNCTTSPIP